MIKKIMPPIILLSLIASVMDTNTMSIPKAKVKTKDDEPSFQYQVKAKRRKHNDSHDSNKVSDEDVYPDSVFYEAMYFSLLNDINKILEKIGKSNDKQTLENKLNELEILKHEFKTTKSKLKLFHAGLDEYKTSSIEIEHLLNTAFLYKYSCEQENQNCSHACPHVRSYVRKAMNEAGKESPEWSKKFDKYCKA